jgi:hypothetical protein
MTGARPHAHAGVRAYVSMLSERFAAASGLRHAVAGSCVEVHSQARSKRGIDVAVVNKPDVLIEGKGVGVRRDFHTTDVLLRREDYDVLHERASHSAPHPVRVYEEIFQFEDPARSIRRRKANDVIGQLGCDAGAAFVDAMVGQEQHIGMSQKLCDVAGVG